eukprot:359853-Chlamydomonas_euryale.AAC.10
MCACPALLLLLHIPDLCSELLVAASLTACTAAAAAADATSLQPAHVRLPLGIIPRRKAEATSATVAGMHQQRPASRAPLGTLMP